MKINDFTQLKELVQQEITEILDDERISSDPLVEAIKEIFED